MCQYFLFLRRVSKMRKISTLIIIVLILSLLLGCGNAQKGLLPESIGQFELSSTTEGEQAKQAVISLHKGADIALKDAAIGDYFSGNSQAKLWVGQTESSTQAMILFGRMTKKISNGKSPFGEVSQKTLKNIKVMEMEAMGQKHYYYIAKDKVVWLSADSSLANEAIADLIEKVR